MGKGTGIFFFQFHLFAALVGVVSYKVRQAVVSHGCSALQGVKKACGVQHKPVVMARAVG